MSTTHRNCLLHSKLRFVWSRQFGVFSRISADEVDEAFDGADQLGAQIGVATYSVAQVRPEAVELDAEGSAHPVLPRPARGDVGPLGETQNAGIDPGPHVDERMASDENVIAERLPARTTHEHPRSASHRQAVRQAAPP